MYVSARIRMEESKVCRYSFNVICHKNVISNQYNNILTGKGKAAVSPLGNNTGAEGAQGGGRGAGGAGRGAGHSSTPVMASWRRERTSSAPASSRAV